MRVDCLYNLGGDSLKRMYLYLLITLSIVSTAYLISIYLVHGEEQYVINKEYLEVSNVDYIEVENINNPLDVAIIKEPLMKESIIHFIENINVPLEKSGIINVDKPIYTIRIVLKGHYPHGTPIIISESALSWGSRSIPFTGNRFNEINEMVKHQYNEYKGTVSP